MSPVQAQRVVLALIPAAILAAIGASAVWGDSGLVARSELTHRLTAANAELAEIERENQRLYRELTLLERDPVAAERAIADGLGWARPGTTVYRFEADAAPAPAPAPPLDGGR